MRELGRRVKDVDLGGVLPVYADAVGKVRDLGVGLSDRRAVKVLKLVAASAVLSGRDAANPSDLWVLRYVWDRVEHFHADCYELAGEPHGEVDTTPVVRNRARAAEPKCA